LAIITDVGDHWVLEGCDPPNFVSIVTVEGVLIGMDRLRVDWIGASAQ